MMKTDIVDEKGEIVARSKEVRKQILDAAALIDESYQSLAQLLHETYDNGYYLRWGFENFKEYCEEELGVQYRKARYLVGIAETIRDLRIKWEDVEGIGWTKMRTLIPILKEEGLVGDWLELAKQYSVKELEALVKDSKAGFDINVGGGDKIVTITFRMTPEQSEIITDALDTAKKVSETTDNVLALEQMSFDYVMQQGEVPEKTSLEALIAFAEKHYGVEIQVAGRDEIANLVEDDQNENAVGQV
jgi:sulfite reductase beta subunit-like hemoprotein